MIAETVLAIVWFAAGFMMGRVWERQYGNKK